MRLRLPALRFSSYLIIKKKLTEVQLIYNAVVVSDIIK